MPSLLLLKPRSGSFPPRQEHLDGHLRVSQKVLPYFHLGHREDHGCLVPRLSCPCHAAKDIMRNVTLFRRGKTIGHSG